MVSNARSCVGRTWCNGRSLCIRAKEKLLVTGAQARNTGACPSSGIHISVTLAYSSRGKAKSFLRKPIFQAPFAPVSVSLAPTLYQPRRAQSYLRYPVLVFPSVAFAGPVAVTLAPTIYPPRRAHSFVRPPVAVLRPLARPVLLGITVQLTRLDFTKFHAKSSLFPPSVVGGGIYFRPVQIHLAPSTDIGRRRIAKSHLFAPAKVRPAIIVVNLNVCVDVVYPVIEIEVVSPTLDYDCDVVPFPVPPTITTEVVMPTLDVDVIVPTDTATPDDDICC